MNELEETTACGRHRVHSGLSDVRTSQLNDYTTVLPGRSRTSSFHSFSNTGAARLARGYRLVRLHFLNHFPSVHPTRSRAAGFDRSLSFQVTAAPGLSRRKSSCLTIAVENVTGDISLPSDAPKDTIWRLVQDGTIGVGCAVHIPPPSIPTQIYKPDGSCGRQFAALALCAATSTSWRPPLLAPEYFNSEEYLFRF